MEKLLELEFMGVVVALRVSLASLSTHRFVASAFTAPYPFFEPPSIPVPPTGLVVALVVSVTRSENTTECPSREFEDMEDVEDAMLTVAVARP